MLLFGHYKYAFQKISENQFTTFLCSILTYLKLGELTEFLGCVEYELSALEEEEKKRRKRERERKNVQKRRGDISQVREIDKVVDRNATSQRSETVLNVRHALAQSQRAPPPNTLAHSHASTHNCLCNIKRYTSYIHKTETRVERFTKPIGPQPGQQHSGDISSIYDWPIL